MTHLISCEFNMDTACVELKFTDGSMIAIDTIAVENEVARNMYERSELDYQNFGEFLQRKRTEKQITLRKMAEMIGITAPYLTDIEKDRRNPPEMEKLELISQILMLNDEDKTTMYDLAGKKRNSVAPDLPDYIMEHDYVSAALRTARDLDASEADWLKFVEELKQRKG